MIFDLKATMKHQVQELYARYGGTHLCSGALDLKVGPLGVQGHPQSLEISYMRPLSYSYIS